MTRFNITLKRAEAIVSFDKHFDMLDIPRLEPLEILAKL